MAELVDYRAALLECGFDASAAAAGAAHAEREVQEGRFLGFRCLVSCVERRGALSGLRPHHREPLVRRIEAMEAAAQLSERFAESSLKTAAARAEDACRIAKVHQDIAATNSALIELMKSMTDREFDGRTPMRPEIAERWRELFSHDQR